MKRIALLIIFACIAGCGKGPKHLSESDYGHGKTAFQLLEENSAASPMSATRTAAEGQIKEVTNYGLKMALMNYSIAISDRGIATMSVHIALNNIQMAELAKSLDAKQKWTAIYQERRQALDELGPILKLCHDDAAQYFDEQAASTNTCASSLEAYDTKYKARFEDSPS